MGLILGVSLVGLSLRRTRLDYEPDRARCMSCGRCFSYCPREQWRRQRKPAQHASPAAQGYL